MNKEDNLTEKEKIERIKLYIKDTVKGLKNNLFGDEEVSDY